MKFTYKYLAIAIFLLLLLINCTKMDDTYSKFIQDGEKVYSVRPTRVKFYPGDKRIKLEIAMLSAPNLKKVRIYWNSRNDSIEWQIEPDLNNDTTFVMGIIDPIDEGRHTFEFITFDNLENNSVKKDTVGVVYGDIYKGSLKSRETQSAIMDLESGQMKLKWSRVPDGNPVESELFYINMEGKTMRLKVPLDEFETYIVGRPRDDSIRFRTVYMPEDEAIDTFYTQLRSVKLTPPPKLLDKSKFKPVILPTDAPAFGSGDMNVIWDDNLNTWWGTINQAGKPHWYTFDLGVKAKLTEYTIWQRGVINEHALVYAHANMKKWELWGSNDPDADGGWSNWTRLIESESHKPSSGSVVTEEDYEYAEGGDTFIFSPHVPKVRYIRVKPLETWVASFSHRSFLSEMSFKGVVGEL